jgi:hypothetical protein
MRSNGLDTGPFSCTFLELFKLFKKKRGIGEGIAYADLLQRAL